jgi:hypothetical protein
MDNSTTPTTSFAHTWEEKKSHASKIAKPGVCLAAVFVCVLTRNDASEDHVHLLYVLQGYCFPPSHYG